MKICIVLGFYFIIGAVGLFIVNRKKPDPLERKEAWRKYYLYLVIVWAGIWFFERNAEEIKIVLTVFYALAFVGLYEVIRVTMGKPWLMVRSIFIYVIIGIYFIASATFGKDLLKFFFLVVVFDGFSQLTGQLIGGAKLIPRISPKKTWSGIIGGFFMTTLTGVLIWKDVPWFLACIICVFAFMGDVLSSLLKRKAGVKDFSNWIPGHGGFLDRFDSFIFVCAALHALGQLMMFML